MFEVGLLYSLSRALALKVWNGEVRPSLIQDDMVAFFQERPTMNDDLVFRELVGPLC
jgi:hypothetical protein